MMLNQTITISKEDVWDEIKLSYQLPQIAEQIITRKIVTLAAKEAGIEVTTEELQQAADKVRIMSQLNDAKSTWEWLEKHRLSLDDFEKVVENTIMSTKLAAHLFQDKVEPYFYEHQLDYSGAIIYEIIFDDEDEAIEVFYEIQEGEISFYDAAQQYIQDKELRRKGGYRGKVNRTQMPPEVSSAVFAASPPQSLQPIVTSKGVHLIVVKEIVTPELDQKLFTIILLNLFKKYLQKQVNNYTIVYD